MFEPALVSTDVLLQNGAPVDTDITGPTGLAGGAIGAFLTTLIVGGILVTFAPTYTERQIHAVLEDPFTSFLYGFLGLVLLAVAVLVLVITIIGIFFAVPLLILAYLAWAVGATIAFLTIAERLVGLDDGWLKPLLVAAAINGALALTGIGGLVSFVIGAIGFGTILRDAMA